MQQSNLLSQLPQIKNLFKPNPMIAAKPLDVVFELNFSEDAERVEIEIKQFIFTRCRVLIPKAGGNFTVVTCGQPDVTGTDDLPALKSALIELGYVNSAKENMVKLFTGATKPKNKYPRKGRVKRR